MKKYRLTQDLLVYDGGVGKQPRFTYSKPRVFDYQFDFSKGDLYEGADRTELGNWLLANNFLEEVKDGNSSSTE